MKLLNTLVLAAAVLFSGHTLADDISLQFVGGNAVDGHVEQVELEKEFTGTSDNSQDVYNKTKNTLENSFAGFVDATLIDHETGEKTEIVLVSDKHEGSAIIALADDKVLFIWRPAPN